MDEIKLKPNLCGASFFCNAVSFRDCVYCRTDEGSRVCRYYRDGYCGSAVAAVNRMTLTLQAMGIPHSPTFTDTTEADNG